jgi:hypothetical protein
MFQAAKKKEKGEKEQNEIKIRPHANEEHEPSRNGLALQLRREWENSVQRKVMN